MPSWTAKRCQGLRRLSWNWFGHPSIFPDRLRLPTFLACPLPDIAIASFPRDLSVITFSRWSRHRSIPGSRLPLFLQHQAAVHAGLHVDVGICSTSNVPWNHLPSCWSWMLSHLRIGREGLLLLERPSLVRVGGVSNGPEPDAALEVGGMNSSSVLKRRSISSGGN